MWVVGVCIDDCVCVRMIVCAFEWLCVRLDDCVDLVVGGVAADKSLFRLFCSESSMYLCALFIFYCNFNCVNSSLR